MVYGVNDLQEVTHRQYHKWSVVFTRVVIYFVVSLSSPVILNQIGIVMSRHKVVEIQSFRYKKCCLFVVCYANYDRKRDDLLMSLGGLMTKDERMMMQR